MHFAEHLYPDIKKLIAEIDIPLEYANENLELGPFDAQLNLDQGVDYGEDEEDEEDESDMDWLASDEEEED
ncbi:hypothetical protein EsH8_VI_000449 [Colletotrichum jinshuiense]